MTSLPTQFTDVMVDVETTGTAPDRAGILQLAAVRFNLQHGTIDTSDMFNRSMWLPQTRAWDESTREWWGNQKPTILEDIMTRAESPRDVMQDFFNWSTFPHNRMRFWAKPLSFDFPFVAGYFRDYDFMNPFHYRVARDLNSYIEALHFPNAVPEVELADLGDAHNALNDCFMQLDLLFKHVDLRKKRDAG